MQTNSKIVAVSLLLLASTCSADSLIGTTIPPYPTGWEDEGGSCIAADCAYSLGVLKKAEERILYFGQSAKQSDNNPLWKVLDQMPYPEAPEGFYVEYSACEHNGQADPSIIAVVKSVDEEWLSTVRFAYKANMTTGQFETLSTQGIRCQNVGWGV